VIPKPAEESAGFFFVHYHPTMPDADHTHALQELARRVRGRVRAGRHDRLLYATDASIYQHTPRAVLLPADLEDAVAGVRACHELGLPVLARGGGTSLAGQGVNDAVVIDLSASCRAWSDLSPDRSSVIAEAGLAPADLNAAIAGTGAFFAPDPSTVRQATIGGCIGNNAAGAHSVLYGRTSENVEAIEACLADGTRVWFDECARRTDPHARRLAEAVADITLRHRALIRERFPTTLRRSAGYQLDCVLDQLERDPDPLSLNLSPLLCGAEGTLAVTLRARLRLHPVPRATGLAVIAFAELDEAIEAVMPLLETGPAAVELLDDLILDLARDNAVQARHVELLPDAGGQTVRAVLYVEYSGADAGEVESRLAGVRERFGAARTRLFTEPDDMHHAWALRIAGEPLLHGIPGSRTPVGFVEDNAVPPQRLAEFVREFRAIVRREETTASFYAHASVGVLHVRPLLNLKDPDDRERMQRIAKDVADLARSLGGVMSGEHGDGRARGPLLEDFFGPELMGAFREVKRAFDPGNRLNPGNIVEPGPLESITHRLRVLPEQRPVPVPETETYFEYDDQSDFAHAVERCNGAGVCRKSEGGVMCPSFRATRDEKSSTRGYGNALRLAITGQGDQRGDGVWNDPDTLATLDLCLSCKGCKSECPSNVDIARLKAEYQAQRYRTVAPSLRTRVMAGIDRWQRLGSVAPGLVNALNRFPLTSAPVRGLLGIHPERSLPRLRRSLARQWEGASDVSPDAPVVVLLADTFTMHNEPEIGLATRRVLEAFGYRVRLLPADDLARASISLGLLPRAIASADRTLARVLPLLDELDPRAVLVCEPSCLSAVTDDWLQLRLRTSRASRERLARLAMLPEQFLDSQWDRHPTRPAFTQPDGGLILHAHCHQRALTSPESSAAILRRVFPGVSLRVLDATCCGMAGSYGFSKDRYELSMRIGELGVLPAAREADDSTTLLATGTSCRHQILDGAQRTAVHPIQLLADRLGG